MVLWYLFLVISVSAIRVHSQSDSKGFISIDCGLTANSSFVDSDTKLTYVSDSQFIDTGVNRRIASQYAVDGLIKQLLTVRSFPNGTRNCYTFGSLTVRSKYLVRGIFMYGNYDNLNKPPIFDIHLGVNYWNTVNITTVDDALFTEIMATATSGYLQVCLVNKGLGTPFISALELRPLKTSIYQAVSLTQSLVYADRLDLGGNDQLRYPDNPYDRIWRNYTWGTWKKISTSLPVEPDTDFDTPSLVIQTAATSSSTKTSIDLSWFSDNTSTIFLIILHIGEIQDIPANDLRQFDIFANGELAYNSTVPDILYSGWASYTHTAHTRYNVSLKATPNSTLPPLMNAFELYIVTPATGVPTDSGDDSIAVNSMNRIKANYKINRGWNGDPCGPTELSWAGVYCTSDSSDVPRITALNLSSSGLTGAVVSWFGNLSALESLDLSYNKLSGPLPALLLDQLAALKFLDITGNDNISTTLPPGLQKRNHDGDLTFRFGNAAPPLSSPPFLQIKDKKSIAVPIAVSVAVVLLLLVACITILYLKWRTTSTPDMLNFDRQFSYEKLVSITDNFKNKIGEGGFGDVYFGSLENKTQVAVKMLVVKNPQLLSLGVEGFLVEARNLTRINHKNLVPLIGYCLDRDHMGLVYEYMQEGTLKDKLKSDNARPLSWKQRLRIAYGSALGLEYLHKACDPPIIHRDVKSDNILLNANLDAKIADFGLSRTFKDDATHVTTKVAGTNGYLDPEYQTTGQLSEKSDVYSFAVVLLEIITGKPPIIEASERSYVHVAHWVKQKLSMEGIESIVDPRMNGHYDMDSVRKVTELALKCWENSSADRPAMNVVAAKLKKRLDLEISAQESRSRNTNDMNPHHYSRNYNFRSNTSQNSVSEMAHMGGMHTPGPTVC